MSNCEKQAVMKHLDAYVIRRILPGLSNKFLPLATHMFSDHMSVYPKTMSDFQVRRSNVTVLHNVHEKKS